LTELTNSCLPCLVSDIIGNSNSSSNNNNTTVLDMIHNSSSASSEGGETSAWVGQARFAIEGVTQGLVGLFGLVGKYFLM
jgi:hypothetical protein